MMANCLWTAATCARVSRESLFAQRNIVPSPCFHQNTMQVSTAYTVIPVYPLDFSVYLIDSYAIFAANVRTSLFCFVEC